MTTVTRKQYNASQTEKTALGLPCEEITTDFDGSVQVGGISIDDAFDIDDLTLTGVAGTGLFALAADIAAVQSQERLIPSGFTGTLVVPGFKMQDEDSLSLMVDGEAVLEDKEVEVAALSDEEIAAKAQMSASALAEGLGAKAVTVFPMSTEVSYTGTLSGVSVLCDRRKSMMVYSVSGATEVAWVPVPWSWWTNLTPTMQTALLAVLGISDRVQAHIGDMTTLSVSDGVITPGDDEVTDLANYSRVFFKVKDGSDRQFAEVGVDGDGLLMWRDNESYVVGILAAVPRVNMQSVLGIAAVCVGIGGGVPGWMVSAHVTYGIALANLVKAFGIDKDIAKSFNGEGRWLVGDTKAYIDTGVIPSGNTNTELEYKITDLTYKGSNTSMFGARVSYGTNDYSFNLGAWGAGSNYYIGYGSNYSISYPKDTDAHIIAIKDGNIVLDGTIIQTIGVKAVSPGRSAYIFMGNFNDNHCLASFARIGKVFMSGDTSHLFIPMTKSSVNGMYDLIGQQFYANANSSGTFTIE